MINKKQIKLSKIENNNNKTFGSKILIILNIILVLLILLSIFSVLVVADKLHSFQQKNEMIEVDGHKIVALDVTTNEECLMTIDGEAFIIREKGNKKGTDEVKIYVKQAIPIRTTDKFSIYCETLIDVIVPRVTETKEIDIKDNTKDKTEETTQANIDDDSINDASADDETVEVNNANGEVNGGVNSEVDAEFNSEANGNISDDKNTEGKSFFAKLWGFIKKLFS